MKPSIFSKHRPLVLLVAALLGLPLSARAESQAFAEKFYREISPRPGNVIFSPLSLRQAYGMLSAGARGPTSAKLREIFELGDSLEAISKESKRINELAKADGIAIANGLWANPNFPLESNFTDSLKRFFNASVATLDLKAGEKPINSWIAAKTDNRVRDLLPPGLVHEGTNLILVNAVAFKGAWKTPFKTAETKPHAFKTATGAAVKVPFMHVRTEVPYRQSLDRILLALPYAGGSLHFVMLLPLELPLATLEKDTDFKSNIAEAFAGPPTEIDLYLPRFEFDQRLDLTPVLAKLGLKTTGDFSGISKKPLGEMTSLHQAYVKVNEEGTEATAATAVATMGAAPPKNRPAVYADRPFLFWIVDPVTKEILFWGRLANPKP